jgi:Ca2+-binding RTX toxin-like protein
MSTHTPAPIQTLEARQFLSVTLTDGIVDIVGTDKVDEVAIAEFDRGRQFYVDFEGEQTAFNTADVKLLRFNMGAGGDTVIVGTFGVPALIFGGKGHDSLSGGTASDTLLGGGGFDYLYGREGNDDMNGNLQGDKLFGGPGDDYFHGGSGLEGNDDDISGQEGFDTLDYGERLNQVNIVLTDEKLDPIPIDDTVRGDVEKIIGTEAGDNIRNGRSRGVIIDGGGGNDVLTGGSGDDTLIGGIGQDSLAGMGGNDVLDVADGEQDTVVGGTGADTLNGNGADDDDEVFSVEDNGAGN